MVTRRPTVAVFAPRGRWEADLVPPARSGWFRPPANAPVGVPHDPGRVPFASVVRGMGVGETGEVDTTPPTALYLVRTRSAAG